MFRYWGNRTEPLPERVDRLENRMAEIYPMVREHDHDIASLEARLRAHTKLLQAVRETQRDHSQELRQLRSQMQDGFSKTQLGYAHIVALLTNKIDEESGEA